MYLISMRFCIRFWITRVIKLPKKFFQVSNGSICTLILETSFKNITPCARMTVPWLIRTKRILHIFKSAATIKCFSIHPWLIGVNDNSLIIFLFCHLWNFIWWLDLSHHYSTKCQLFAVTLKQMFEDVSHQSRKYYGGPFEENDARMMLKKLICLNLFQWFSTFLCPRATWWPDLDSRAASH